VGGAFHAVVVVVIVLVVVLRHRSSRAGERFGTGCGREQYAHRR
jgi:hypothetical protein